LQADGALVALGVRIVVEVDRIVGLVVRSVAGELSFVGNLISQAGCGNPMASPPPPEHARSASLEEPPSPRLESTASTERNPTTY
jgi:hypothetical protein